MLNNKKDEIKKSKKGKESIIGKIIYGFLLFMPLLAITSAIIVNTFNNQAKDEVNIVYKYETNELNSLDDLVVGNIYTLDLSVWSPGDGVYTSYIQFTGIDVENSTTSSSTIIENGYIYFWFYNDIYTFELNGLSTLAFNTIVNNKIDIVYQLDTFEDYQVLLNGISKCENIPIERVEQKNITNVFYEAVDDIENSPLFNWSKNSELYTVIHNTCNILDLTNTFIPMLMTYWVIISIIYVIYDIALIALHVVHRKIHELQDSI